MSLNISVDVSKVVRAMEKLSKGLDQAAATQGMKRAVAAADRVRGLTPVYTGNLRSTVHASTTEGGGEVHYGAALPYAGKIERSQHPVERGIAGEDARFQQDMTNAAEAEVNAL